MARSILQVRKLRWRDVSCLPRELGRDLNLCLRENRILPVFTPFSPQRGSALSMVVHRTGSVIPRTRGRGLPELIHAGSAPPRGRRLLLLSLCLQVHLGPIPPPSLG